ncbi:acyl--CoA ligase [Aquabacterium sp. A7-Y]|uniref:class I adenylate-forming enzyme family protein n=1 Tax=Aquabacterium sp. A7-Y TaxID=1349605 RepID=UPI00223D8AFC|nr:class I adenylate-forming enzyme family protein [Aquabacterium sp. A7-Y]MCW7536952.1 acyl--CoA ligase [Aquabacterium sp. A7-Y]
MSPSPAIPASPCPPVMSLALAHGLMTRPGSFFEIEQVDIRGIPTRVWKYAPPTLREVFLAGRQHGDHTFLVYEGERASFESFARATLALAQALAAQGVVKGERVAIAMRNLPEWPVAYFATLLLGAIAAPLNAWGTPADLLHGLTDSGARVAVLDAERWERLQPGVDGCPELAQVLVSRHRGALMHPRARALEQLIGRVCEWPGLPDRPLPPVPLAPDDDATLFYTSGTTGSPKGALGTHRCSTSTLMASAFSALRGFVRRGEPPPDPAARTTQRTLLVSVPFFHTTGCQGMCGALFAGSKLVLMHRWEVGRALQLIEAERVTHAGGVPTIAWQLLEHPAVDRYDLSSLEAVAYGGAPASPELVERLQRVFPQAEPGTAWGMTETSAGFTGHSGDDYRAKPASAGPAPPVGELKITDDTGRPLPAGQIGELWVKGPNVVKGYWRRPEDTAQTFVDGWLRTGDLAYLDDEGWLFIVDRKKDMLIRGGENIYCAEIESALYKHPAVVDAGVVGVPHASLGEEPAALVVLRPGETLEPEALREFLRGHLSAYKLPVSIVIHPELLPRNPAGKLMKPALKQLLQAALSRS